MTEYKDEVERRFLTFNRAWEALVDPSQARFIRQAYPPELQEPDVFGRVRDTLMPGGNHVFEVGRKKAAEGLRTPEAESETPEAEFERHFRNSGNQHLRKWRNFIYAQPGITFMLDRFTHIQEKRVNTFRFVLTEIEFEGEAVKLAEDFQPPHWIGPEVTGDHQFSNYSLCVNGIPYAAIEELTLAA